MNWLVQSSEPSTERVFFGAVLTLGASALLLFAIQLSERLGLASHESGFVFWAEVVVELWVLAIVVVGGPITAREMKDRRLSAASAVQARREVESLFHMTDMLQSAIGYSDANAVLRATGAKLLPDHGGALYVFNNSRDRLDLSTSWNWPGERGPEATISPTPCWALMRGKANLNLPGANELRCEHHVGDLTVLEIPMMARGEVYGLLKVEDSGPDAEARLAEAQPIGRAIADAMSLALSNIALREKLRTQALRDALTGLYNRRYMEDTLDRFANLAERSGSSLTAIMIDLDHFKKLNDEHGHALGDAVLTEVASVIMGGIRPCDVACRYGGEELVVLLPDCTLREGAKKAEILRTRIEALSENHGARITASFGVASIPESSQRVSEILANADAALFKAKAQGRNCVVTAPLKRVGTVELIEAAE